MSIQATCITLEYQLGNTRQRALCPATPTGTCWTHANRRLARWATWAPAAGCPVDFRIHYADGLIYDGVILLTPADPNPDLAAHVAEFSGVYSGQYRPPGMTDAGWHNWLGEIARLPGTVAEYRHFRARYAIPTTHPAAPCCSR
jgi:hypothetical protein